MGQIYQPRPLPHSDPSAVYVTHGGGLIAQVHSKGGSQSPDHWNTSMKISGAFIHWPQLIMWKTPSRHKSVMERGSGSPLLQSRPSAESMSEKAEQSAEAELSWPQHPGGKNCSKNKEHIPGLQEEKLARGTLFLEGKELHIPENSWKLLCTPRTRNRLRDTWEELISSPWAVL